MRPNHDHLAARFKQPARSERTQISVDHSIDDVAVGVQLFDHAAQVGSGEDVHGLFLDHDLPRAFDLERALAVGNDDALFEQGGPGLPLAPRPGNTVVRPDLELGVVLRVGVHGRDHRNAAGGGETVELCDRRHDPLGAGT